MTPHSYNSFQLKFFQLLLKVRPAEFGQLLKKCFGIHREAIATSLGYAFWADPVSVFGQALLNDKIYEPQMSKLVAGLLREGDMFVDIGGNEGYFSVIASKKVGKGKVFCVEPQSRLLPVLEKNFSLNGCRNIQVSHLALSESKGETEIFLRPDTNTGSSSLFKVSKLGSTKETVATDTLENFFKDNGLSQVRLMKIDCEGAEGLVIRGGRSVFREKKVAILALEYHPHVLSRSEISEIDLFLKESGYRHLEWRGQTLYCLPEFEGTVYALS